MTKHVPTPRKSCRLAGNLQGTTWIERPWPFHLKSTIERNGGSWNCEHERRNSFQQAPIDMNLISGLPERAQAHAWLNGKLNAKGTDVWRCLRAETQRQLLYKANSTSICSSSPFRCGTKLSTKLLQILSSQFVNQPQEAPEQPHPQRQEQTSIENCNCLIYGLTQGPNPRSYQILMLVKVSTTEEMMASMFSTTASSVASTDRCWSVQEVIIFVQWLVMCEVDVFCESVPKKKVISLRRFWVKS